MEPRADLAADSDLAEALLPVAISAGAAILAVRRAGAHVEWKADSSPVTEADRAAEAVIAAALAEIAPGVPVIAEEAAYEGRVPATGAAFFLVDPLDGTKEFVKGGNDFTVNIGLIRNSAPVLGVIYLPATGKLFWGVVGAGAWRALVVAAPSPNGGRSACARRPTAALPWSPAARTARPRPTPISAATTSTSWSRPAPR